MMMAEDSEHPKYRTYLEAVLLEIESKAWPSIHTRLIRCPRCGHWFDRILDSVECTHER